jgi:outer membrane protein TolC
MANPTRYIPRPLRRTLRPILAFSVLLAGGCTAEYYERQADRQVLALVKDRETKTLGYQPQVDVPSDEKITKPTRQAFVKIPQTAVPREGQSQVEPLKVELQYAPLGPKRFDWGDAQSTDASESNPIFESLDARIRDRLRLGPPSLAERPVRLNFFDALQYGVQHSREYQREMEDLYRVALRVTLERHLFTPRPTAGASLRYAGGQRDVNYNAALRTAVSAGVTQKLPYGGEIVAEGLVDFVSALDGTVNSGESAELALRGSLPLLKGAGMVNLEPLISQERQLVYQVREFEDFRRAFVINVATQYFRLLNRQQSVLNRRLNYASYVTLTERSRALYAAGRVAFLELQRSLQELLQAENTLIDSQETYLASLDEFKLLLGMPTEQPLEIVPVELDVNLPKISETEALDLAFKYRLDLQTLRDRTEDARRQVSNARNGLLPEVNLVAQGTIGNRSNTAASRIDERTNEYSAGVDIDLPLDRVRERNVYRGALIDVRAAQRSLEAAKDLVASDVRESLRLMQESQLTLQIQRQGIDLAERRRENAYTLLRSGKSTSTRDLVEAQNSLLRARDAFEQARATLQINVLRFLRNSGTLRLDPSAGAIGHAMDRLAEPNLPTKMSNISLPSR